MTSKSIISKLSISIILLGIAQIIVFLAIPYLENTKLITILSPIILFDPVSILSTGIDSTNVWSINNILFGAILIYSGVLSLKKESYHLIKFCACVIIIAAIPVNFLLLIYNNHIAPNGISYFKIVCSVKAIALTIFAIQILINCKKSNSSRIDKTRKLVETNNQQRSFHFILDSYIFFTPTIVAITILITITPRLNSYLPIISLAAITQFLIYFLFELILNKTPSKFITNSIILTLDGQNFINLQNITKRTLARLIPFESLSFLSGHNWHDTFSDTSVFSEDIRTSNTLYGYNLFVILTLLSVLQIGLNKSIEYNNFKKRTQAKNSQLESNLDFIKKGSLLVLSPFLGNQLKIMSVQNIDNDSIYGKTQDFPMKNGIDNREIYSRISMNSFKNNLVLPRNKMINHKKSRYSKFIASNGEKHNVVDVYNSCMIGDFRTSGKCQSIDGQYNCEVIVSLKRAFKEQFEILSINCDDASIQPEVSLPFNVIFNSGVKGQFKLRISNISKRRTYTAILKMRCDNNKISTYKLKGFDSRIYIQRMN
jgi:hypothetical protein